MRTGLRLQLSAALCLVPLIPIALRLGYLQIVRHQDFSTQILHRTESQTLQIVPRGRILDRSGRVLAQSTTVDSCFVDRYGLRADKSSGEAGLRALAAVLEQPLPAIRAQLRQRTRNVWIQRDVPEAKLLALRGLQTRYPWIGLQADQQRRYPNEELARGILGSVNSSDRGSSGLELSFDRKISAQAIPVASMRDGDGRSIRERIGDAGAPPPDLRLTLDSAIQYYAEAALSEAMAKHRAKAGTVLVQDPRTGEILAMALAPNDALRNAAIQDVYEPGSTFKVVVAAGALESGVMNLTDKLDCENGRWAVNSKVTIKDHDKQGLLTLPEIIQHSSNIGSGKLGLKMGAAAFLKQCALFGFGYRTGVPLPGESSGIMGAAATLRDVRLANAAFGQGVAVTPIQLLSAYSAIANGGELLEPRLVLAIGDEPTPGPVRVRRVAKAETIAEVRKMLELVVDAGTGSTSRLAGYRTAGKTGTAQKVDPGTGQYSENEYIASFVGYFPARDPLFTVLVVIDSPQGEYYGAQVAAPVFAKLANILLAMKGVPPETPLAVDRGGEKIAPAEAAPAPVPASPKLPAPRQFPAPARPAAAPARPILHGEQALGSASKAA